MAIWDFLKSNANWIVPTATTIGYGAYSKNAADKAASEQRRFYEEQAQPYEELFGDVFEPSTRQMGNLLAADLTEPFQLPDDVWEKTWQKARERTLAEYEPITLKASQRMAGSGLLGQPVGEKFFQDIDLAKAKSIESQAVEQSIAEWNEKKQAKQTAINNMMAFLGREPNIPQQSYTPSPGADISGAADIGTKMWDIFNPQQTAIDKLIEYWMKGGNQQPSMFQNSVDMYNPVQSSMDPNAPIQLKGRYGDSGGRSPFMDGSTGQFGSSVLPEVFPTGAAANAIPWAEVLASQPEGAYLGGQFIPASQAAPAGYAQASMAAEEAAAAKAAATGVKGFMGANAGFLGAGAALATVAMLYNANKDKKTAKSWAETPKDLWTLYDRGLKEGGNATAASDESVLDVTPVARQLIYEKTGIDPNAVHARTPIGEDNLKYLQEQTGLISGLKMIAEGQENAKIDEWGNTPLKNVITQADNFWKTNQIEEIVKQYFPEHQFTMLYIPEGPGRSDDTSTRAKWYKETYGERMYNPKASYSQGGGPKDSGGWKGAYTTEFINQLKDLGRKLKQIDEGQVTLDTRRQIQ